MNKTILFWIGVSYQKRFVKEDFYQHFFNGCCSDHLKYGVGGRCIRVCFSFSFLFSAQNHVPQIIIGMNRVIYSFKAMPVVIPVTLKTYQKLSQYRERRLVDVLGLKFLIFSL